MHLYYFYSFDACLITELYVFICVKKTDAKCNSCNLTSTVSHIFVLPVQKFFYDESWFDGMLLITTIFVYVNGIPIWLSSSIADLVSLSKYRL